MALIPFEGASGLEMLKTKDVHLVAEIGTGVGKVRESQTLTGNSRTQVLSLF